MQAVVLAAGTGQRIMPLTNVIPKALLPIANRPLLEYAVLQLERAGLRDITIVTGYMGQRTMSGLKDSGEDFQAEINYINTEEYAKGPIFSLLAAEKLVQGRFLLTPVDLILPASIIPKMLANCSEDKVALIAIDSHSSGSEGTSVSYSQLSDRGSTSVQSIGSSKILGDEQTGAKTFQGTSIGIAVCPTEIFEYARMVARNGSTKVVDALNWFISHNGKVQGVMIDEKNYWFDVDTIETALAANRFILQTPLLGETPKGKLYNDGSADWTGHGCLVSRGSPAQVFSPSIIGDGCEIGSASKIGPYVSAQRGCQIGRNVSCRNSIILEGSRIDDYTSVQNAIVYGRKILSVNESKHVTSYRVMGDG